MKRIKIATIIAVLLFMAVNEALSAPTMAFGYLANESRDSNYEYLEIIFPNSFANSIKNIFDVRVIKPQQINERLKKYKIELARKYKTFEVSELMEKINTDFFIYGKFNPLPDNNILIVLNLYERGSNRIFTFSNVGKMESEIFKLVDRITQILINLMDVEEFYKTEVVPKGARCAFLTNLEGDELNTFYYCFGKEGYAISYLQGNYLYNHVTEDMINKFKYIYSENNSYDIITDQRKVKFLYGTWSGEDYDIKVAELKKIYKYYDMEYPQTKARILNKIDGTFGGTIDYLLIAGFDKRRKSAWVRCIEIKNQNLMWMQSNIKGSDVESIGNEIAKNMTVKMKVPFENK